MLGSPYDDTIIGNAHDNTLIGGGGLDVIAGLGRQRPARRGRHPRRSCSTSTPTSSPASTSTPRPSATRSRPSSTADYAGFLVHVHPDAAAVGSVHDDHFNDPVLVGLEGGVATGIDWRDLDIAGSRR